MGYYYSSPIKGWLAWPVMDWFGLKATWNGLLLAARMATVLTAFGAARAWGFGARGSLAAAAVYGCSPFFHGYAVEGIVEGTDGWTLALWLWALGAGRLRLAAVPFALTVLSSWYLGMVACLMGALLFLQQRRVLWSVAGGLLLAAPALLRFTDAFPGTAPLEDDIRAAMGAVIQLPTPGWTDGLNPFAMTSYIGWLTLGCALWSRTRLAALAAIPAVLSLGVGPIYDLPVAELVRFPYRWHAGTLVCLAGAVAVLADEKRWGTALAGLIALEGLLLSPVEPILPGSYPVVPDIVTLIDGPVLDIPGPVAMPPGKINMSRGRARYLLYEQTQHHQPSPWVPDFNSVGVAPTDNAERLTQIGTIDRRVSPTKTPPIPVEAINDLDVQYVQVHHEDLGHTRVKAVVNALKSTGWNTVKSTRARTLLRRPSQ